MSGQKQRTYDETVVVERLRCIFSNPAHPHKLYRLTGGSSVTDDCFSCERKGKISNIPFWRDSDYYCTVCDLEFHQKCLEYPSKMIHPYHPQHPLIFTFLDYETGIIVDTNFDSFNKKQISEHGAGSKSNIVFDNCTWCGNDLGQWFYRCSVSSFSLDINCATNNPPLTIQNPKSHHHSLLLFPRPLSFPCDACGLINVREPSYSCYQCSYVVHHSCINLPRVMKITRHPHRLSYNPYLPTKSSLCRICYRNVDIKYGQYSCNHGDCSYVVHSKCATHKKIWAGGELEWEPEEPDETEDIAPFKKVGDGVIEHFCHQHHHLKLKKYDKIRDSEKQCEACIRPISPQDFYNCIECDFFLHEVCANLPRKLGHALHNHPLFLEPDTLYHYYGLKCTACSRRSTGFKYKCRENRCNRREPFQLDVSCISVPECFTHKSHEEHPMFISISYNDEDEVLCHGCKESVYGNHLHCTICEFSICYTCATIPNEIYHKFDEHPFSLCYGESGVEDIYWCEVCETRLDPTEWFYTNNERCTTIHRKCIFGDSAYMKSGHVFGIYKFKFDVVSNGSSSRPICFICHHHCSDPVYFNLCGQNRTSVRFRADTVFCSFNCFLHLVYGERDP